MGSLVELIGRKTVAGACLSALTLALLATTRAGVANADGFENLGFETNQWFNVDLNAVGTGTIANGDPTGSGAWTVPDGVTVTKESSFISMGTTNIVTFTPGPHSITSGYETVVARIKADARDELPTLSPAPQAAFTVAEINDTVGAYGYTSAGWTNLTGVTVADLTNAWFKVYVDFAKDKVRYSVEPDGCSRTVLMNGETEWFSSGRVAQPTVQSIAFSGAGSVQEFCGKVLKLISIDIGVDGSANNVQIGTNVTWVAEMMQTNAQNVAELFATNAPQSITHGTQNYNYFECYALGLDPEEENDVPTINATPDGSGGFNMTLEGIKVPNGVTLTVQLRGSTDGTTFADIYGKTATAVGSPSGTTSSGAIAFDPATEMGGSNVKYFKLQVTIGATTE